MESSASAGRAASAVLDPRRWRALALLCGAFFMVLLDATITIVANPLAALTEGYQSAFLACTVPVGTGLALAFLLPADRGSQCTSCQSRTRRPVPLPQETWRSGQERNERTAHRLLPTTPPAAAIADNPNQEEQP